VLELDEALESPFLRSNKMIAHVPHPERPGMRVLANPIKINGERLSQQVCSAPGADNAAVLGSPQAAAAD
jgi:crotonobetainyl-CoA:carnitine CoA-transferase CaiB-like acyl-CoA transferase